MSFSFRNGVPDGYVVYDCRSLPNPHNVPHLKPLTGKDKQVQDFLLAHREATDMLLDALRDVNRGNRVAFGCVGGRHRSVAMAIALQRWAALLRKPLDVVHRELD